MSYGLYLSAEGAQVQAKRLEFIANNLANLETPGFKRDLPIFQARFAEAIQQGSASPGDKTDNNVGGGVKLHEVETDFSRSTLRHTKIPTDFAINGQGFFRVLGPNDEQLLTRAGNFELNVQGQLVTRDGGLPVLDDSGGVISIDQEQPWSFASGGMIEQGGQATPIGLQVPQSMGDLVKVGNNLFRPLGPATELPSAERDIRQGYLEQSGVSSTREMLSMIETSRAFEANTQLIQHQDGMLSSLISRRKSLASSTSYQPGKTPYETLADCTALIVASHTPGVLQAMPLNNFGRLSATPISQYPPSSVGPSTTWCFCSPSKACRTKSSGT